MNVPQLSKRLSLEAQARFIQAPVWRKAARRGQSWSEAIVDRSAVIEAVPFLSPHASIVLKQMILNYAVTPVEKESLLTAVRQFSTLSGAECRLGLAELEGAGILFAVRKVWDESLYFLPSDAFLIWQQALYPYSPDLICDSQWNKIMNGRIWSSHRPLGRQLLSALSVLAKQGMDLTAKGAIPKKTMAKLEQAAELEEQWLQPYGMRRLLPEHHSLKAAFILEAASALGLLHKGEDGLHWDEVQLCSWLQEEQKTRERELLNWCLNLLLPAAVDGAHKAAALRAVDDGKWQSTRRLEQWAAEAGLISAKQQAQKGNVDVLSWCRLLHTLGWLEVIELEDTEGQELFFRWIPLLSSQDKAGELKALNNSYVTVQPNGELLVDQNCPFLIRWELELIAEKLSDEQVTIYRLDASAVVCALENGRTKQTIQAFLIEASGGQALPLAVESMLETWSSRACRSEFVEATLLRCDHAEMADYIEGIPAIAPLLLEKLGHSHFIVDSSSISELRRLLGKAGYPPRKGVHTSDARSIRAYPIFTFSKKEEMELNQEDDGCCPSTAVSYLYEYYPLQHFELPEALPAVSMESLYKLENIPGMWTRQLRAYHHSTRKELIEQALRWQTPVELRMNEELKAFVPEKLESWQGSWAVVGKLQAMQEIELIRLTPDMWDEMRLLIPGCDATI